MPLFPLFAQLEGRPVLVVGGGEVASRKIEALLQAGARVQVHAHAVSQSVRDWIEDGRIDRRDGEFDPAWLDEAWLVVAATDDRAFNARLASEAERRRLFVNVVDDAELSTFHIPAIVDRAPLQVAISSGGAAPMLARRLREQLEIQLDHSLGELAALFARHRDAIRERLPDLAQRRRWFEQVMDGSVPSLLQAGERAAADDALRAMLQRPDMPAAGSVMLVGTGNGDPGLLTLKALRAMNQADLLLHADVGAAVLAMARRDAPRLPMPPDRSALVALLHDRTRAGLRVVCLRAGDAFRDASTDELLRDLAQRGVQCEVIAGIAG
ncbi:NAD(P)-dependent oxidoreductase [Lysobacter sp.]|uniref:NAD(P)-dependent oxidoreductase n=1 Tax=Lysobacter sp. TaxID=72226 RepID=UPI002D46B275|nr:NAD(P)-dependent oxidoreductase [Lysobacter sp.]HZX76889.1 NAD(P)-dependent oxidoreductase [Lysobacter sp.]